MAWSTEATWLGVALCLSQSAMFSGLNLALFSVSRLRLQGVPGVAVIIALVPRRDARP
ncbi:MAG: hypothetical protein WCA01_14795 [Burkholderiales bacterium]